MKKQTISKNTELTAEEKELLSGYCGCCGEEAESVLSGTCACCGGPSQGTYCSMSCSAKAKVGRC